MEGLETSLNRDKEIMPGTNQSQSQGCSQDGMQYPCWQTNQMKAMSIKNVKRDDEPTSDAYGTRNSREAIPAECS